MNLIDGNLERSLAVVIGDSAVTLDEHHEAVPRQPFASVAHAESIPDHGVTVVQGLLPRIIRVILLDSGHAVHRSEELPVISQDDRQPLGEHLAALCDALPGLELMEIPGHDRLGTTVCGFHICGDVGLIRRGADTLAGHRGSIATEALVIECTVVSDLQHGVLGDSIELALSQRPGQSLPLGVLKAVSGGGGHAVHRGSDAERHSVTDGHIDGHVYRPAVIAPSDVLHHPAVLVERGRDDRLLIGQLAVIIELMYESRRAALVIHGIEQLESLLPVELVNRGEAEHLSA
nr:MAG: hypothetical protein [Bacteriophage sp.]